jgi:hypothetical protein
MSRPFADIHGAMWFGEACTALGGLCWMDGMRPVAVSSTASSRRWLPKPAILGSRGDTLEAFEDGETGRRGGGAAEVGETWGSVSALKRARECTQPLANE